MRNATPNQRTACSAQSACCTIAPIPATPAMVSAMSDRMHTVTIAPTRARRSPWRSTKAFCAPIATMSDRPVSSPVTEALSMIPTLGGPDSEGKRKLLMIL